MNKKLLRVFLVFFLLPASALADDSYADFAALPFVESPVISPNGKRIAAVLNQDSGPVVVVTDFPDINYLPIAALKKDKDRIEDIYWSGDHFLVIDTSFPNFFRGQHFRTNRIYVADLRNNQVGEITRTQATASRYRVYYSDVIVSVLPNDPDHILVATYDEADEGRSLFIADLNTRKLTKIINNSVTPKIDSWSTDRNGNWYVGYSLEEKSDKHILTAWRWDAEGSKLVKINERILGENNTFSIAEVDSSGKIATVISDYQTGRQSLWHYDLIAGEFTDLIFDQGVYDIEGTLIDRDGFIVGAYYYDDFRRHYYFDGKSRQLDEAVKPLFAGQQITVATLSKDYSKALIYAVTDSMPGRYYYLDLASKKGGVWLPIHPKLEGRQFSSIENISFKARDGVGISGYLTMPAGTEKPPLIVMPHGGPHSRDYKYFDPMVQYLASRGYAVLQVNFRGSSGFGSAFEVAGYYQWGKKMQEDVYDAMDWLLATGRVSKDKVCIVGGSYGGFVALTAAFQQPDRFDCVVSMAGVSDLAAMVQDDARSEIFVGHIVKDKESDSINALKSVSAIHNMASIKAPILLVTGNKDTRVDYSQSKNFYKKFSEKGTVYYIEQKDGTHFFDNAEHRLELYREMDKFFDKHFE